MEKESKGGITYFLRRYFIDAMGMMSYGIFSSLIIGVILAQLAGFEPLSFLMPIADILKNPYVCGAAVGAAIAMGLKSDPLVVFSTAGAGAVGFFYGGPVGAYLSGIIGAELGGLVSKKTKVDIIITPLVTVISGGAIGMLVGPYINNFMQMLKSMIDASIELMPLLMGVAVGVIVGMVLTLPISSAALCIMIGMDGLAAGAAVAGCCAQMIGFAVASFRDNGVSGLISQGIGTSMLQMPNIVRRPQIWIAPTVASAVCGALATTVFKMSCSPEGAGMGTSGLVGQITTYAVMSPSQGGLATILKILCLHFLIPAIVTLCVDMLLRRTKIVKPGDMTLTKI